MPFYRGNSSLHRRAVFALKRWSLKETAMYNERKISALIFFALHMAKISSKQSGYATVLGWKHTDLC